MELPIYGDYDAANIKLFNSIIILYLFNVLDEWMLFHSLVNANTRRAMKAGNIWL